jgi:DNA modification methylase
VLVGHVLSRLGELPDESVHCVVTSPPYYGLRSYGTEPQVWGGDPKHDHVFGEEQIRGGSAQKQGASSQRAGRANVEEQSGQSNSQGAFCHCGAWRGDLGLEPTPELFIAHMVDVFREVRRVLRKDGTLWLNIGDSYAGAKGFRPEHANTSTLSGGKNHIGLGRGAPIPADCKAKDLLMIPAQLALALRAGFSRCSDCNRELRSDLWPVWNGHRFCPDCPRSKIIPTEPGWWLRSEIVWAKKAPMPESCTDRPTCAHEKVFLLTKSARYFYDAEAVKEEGEGYGRSNWPAMQFKGGDITRGHGTKGISKGTSTHTYEGGRNMRNVWHLGPEPFSGAHLMRDVGGGSGRIRSPDCPLHGDRPTLASKADRGARQGVSRSARNHNSDARPALGLFAEPAPIELTRGERSEDDNLGSPYPAYSGSAKPHSTQIRRTDPDAEISPHVIADALSASHTGDSALPLDSVATSVRIPENSSAADIRDESSVQTNGHSADKCSCKQSSTLTDHFATFVSEIPRRAILAGTSAEGVCPKCGAPWVRVVEKSVVWPEKRGGVGNNADRGDGGLACNADRSSQTIGWRPSCSCDTLEIGCSGVECYGDTLSGDARGSDLGKIACRGPGSAKADLSERLCDGAAKQSRVGVTSDLQPIPATVLDPFLGAGTTMMVADRLGRNCVGVELITEYAAMGGRRLERDVGPLVRGSVEVR